MFRHIGALIRIIGLLTLCALPAFAQSVYLPGFQEEVAFANLDAPVVIAFAPDGRVLIAEQKGTVLIYDDLNDTTPDQLIDVQNDAHFFIDRGILGMALDPDWPNNPYVYLLYTLNIDLNDPTSTIPEWPDSCPSPPGPTADGCTVDGRVSRFQVALGSNTLVGGEQVLVEGRWCQQFPRNSVGQISFDPLERVLLISAGEGASYTFVDYGQAGGSAGSPTPPNPCDDPPVGRGGAQTPPTAEGGALRAQDLRTSGDPVSFDGTIIRIDPDTGAAAAGNPLIGNGVPDDDPIVAYGLRNPYRMAVRPGTHELWIGDIGWNDFEEINRIPDVTDSVVENFGWPCYEGNAPQSGYDALDLDICENLYSDVTDPAVGPYYTYAHGQAVDPTPTPLGCSNSGTGAIASLVFYDGAEYPASYSGALFFADFTRRCIWTMFLGPGGEPDPGSRTTFADGIEGPAEMVVGPDGNLYVVEFFENHVTRIVFDADNLPPTAAFEIQPPFGTAPLNFTLDATASSDPDVGDTLSYSWDLDDDGSFNEAIGQSTFSNIASADGVYPISLRVSDAIGEFDIASSQLIVGNTPPTATIVAPSPMQLWTVGDTIQLDGDATDAQDGTLPESAYEWVVRLFTCPDGGACDVNTLVTFSGTSTPSFVAPDQQWDAYLEIELTVTDSGIPGSGLGTLSDTATIQLSPLTVEMTYDSLPPGLQVVVGGHAYTTPVTRTAIAGSTNSVTAISPQDLESATFEFSSWLDDPLAEASRTIVGPSVDTTYTIDFSFVSGCLSQDTTCDGVDDDCDMMIDDDFGVQQTSCGVGVCASTGTATCVNGEIVDDCTVGSPIGPDDTCDGLDDDCNGEVDDQFQTSATSCGLGACSGNTGTESCISGAVIDDCDPFAGASFDDTCDGIDDDCDGEDDEHFVDGPTTCGLGECAFNTGFESCVDGVYTDSCDPLAGAVADDDCNGQDDDCDGISDDDFVDGPNSCGLGECAGNTGEQSCALTAPTIYGANRDADMIALDLGTNTESVVDTIAFGSQAIERDPDTGVVYYFEHTDQSDEFGYWDPVTGDDTLIRQYVPSPNFFPKRMAIAPNGQMYMMTNDESLYLVDKANGDLTLLGVVTGLPSGEVGAPGDIAFGTNGVLLVATYDALYTINLDTLNANLRFSGLLSGTGLDVFTGLAVCNGFVFATDVLDSTGLSSVYRINPNTGLITFLWELNTYVNDLTSCPANGRSTKIFTDTCDPFAGSAPDDSCNGLDEDCDGSIDEHIPAPDAVDDTITLDATSIRWHPATDADDYQVVRGDLMTLGTLDGDFSAATTDCLAPAVVGVDTSHGAAPSPGEGRFYLVRSRRCVTTTSYDSMGLRQDATRDPGISASGQDCP